MTKYCERGEVSENDGRCATGEKKFVSVMTKAEEVE